MGRFINADDVSFLDPNTVNGLNLYTYCDNDPVNAKDPSGCGWFKDRWEEIKQGAKSAWEGTKTFFNDTFGAYVDLSSTVKKAGEDLIFFGYENGITRGGSIGDKSKPISVFASNAGAWYKFWEYQVGLNINIGNFSYSYSVGVGEQNYSVGWKDSTVNLQSGINKIGVGVSHTADDETIYNQFYIRTIPTAVAVVTAIYMPYFLPAEGAMAYLN